MTKFKASDLLKQQEEINKSFEELVIRLCDFNKEPLGKEFSDILYENLWGLYVTDEDENQLDMWDEFGTGL